MAKLSDVAKKAGVSPTTVSRVINNYGSISEKTRKNVHDAMNKLNYQPNSLARSLQGKKAQLIGLIFPSITNPFFAELVDTLEQKLFSLNYKVILCNASDNPEKERTYLKMLVANQVDGIIVGTHSTGIKEYQTLNLPIVSFDRYLAPTIPTISGDNYQGANLATQELIDSHATHILYIGKNHNGQINNPTDHRDQAFVETLAQNHLQPHFLELDNHASNNIKRMQIKELLTKQPDIDGIFTSDDTTALLVMAVAKQLKINIPEQLRVVGYDGSKFIQDFHPELTTISQPINDISDLLIETLLDRIDNHTEFNKRKFVLPNKLIKSNTTKNN